MVLALNPFQKTHSTEPAMTKQAQGTPAYLYKIVSPECWKLSKTASQLTLSPMDDEFIHLATEAQVKHVTAKFWAGKDYIVLKVDVNGLMGNLVFETNPGRTTKYYHLYDGYIPTSAVCDVQETSSAGKS